MSEAREALRSALASQDLKLLLWRRVKGILYAYDADAHSPTSRLACAVPLVTTVFFDLLAALKRRLTD